MEHVVIIGAGIGGLAAALRLAHAGAAVTVVERGRTPGGKMRQVETPAGPADCGPTVITMRAVFDRLFAEAGLALERHVSLDRLPIVARHFWPDGSQLDLAGEAERDAAAVGALAGAAEARAFRRFDAEARALLAAFEAPMIEAPTPRRGGLAGAALVRPGLWPLLARRLDAHLGRRFADPRLRQLFGRYATYVGGRPEASPALLALVWAAEARGVWRVRGGVAALARAVAAAAEGFGATFRFGAEARRVELRDGRATGVRLASGERLPAAAVLFNGDPNALAEGLLGTDLRRAARTGPRSLSACVWALAGRWSGPELAYHSVLFGPPGGEFPDLARGRLPRAPSLYICAADRGPDICAADRGPDAAPHEARGRTGAIAVQPPRVAAAFRAGSADGSPHGDAAAGRGAERFEIVVNAPPGLAPEEARACRIRLTEALARHGATLDPLPPGPNPPVPATPALHAALYPGSGGALYGGSPHGALSSLRRPGARTAVPGLYLCGGGAHPGPGVPMAARSGRHAAEAILSDLGSRWRFRPAATPGGTSMASPTTAPAA